MKNNKGFASSFILFSLLILFLLIISILMVTVNNTSSLSGKLKNQLLNDIETSELYRPYDFYSNNGVQEFIVPKDGNYTIKAWSANNNFVTGNIDLKNGDKLYIYVGNNNGYNNGITEVRTIKGDLADQESINSRIILVGQTIEESYISENFKDIVKKTSSQLEDNEKKSTSNGFVNIHYTLSAKNLGFDDEQTKADCDNVQCMLDKLNQLINGS